MPVAESLAVNSVAAGAHHLSDIGKGEPVLAAGRRYRGTEHEARELRRVATAT